MIISALLSLVIILGVMMFIPGIRLLIYPMYACMVILGVATGFLNLQGWIYLIEFIPRKY